MLYYSENITGSIGRINLQLGEVGNLIMKGVGEVQGELTNYELFMSHRPLRYCLLEYVPLFPQFSVCRCNTVQDCYWDFLSLNM